MKKPVTASLPPMLFPGSFVEAFILDGLVNRGNLPKKGTNFLRVEECNGVVAGRRSSGG
jgi:hypothetical protein